MRTRHVALVVRAPLSRRMRISLARRSEAVPHVQLHRIVAIEHGKVREVDEELAVDLVARRLRATALVEHELEMAGA